eukprot:COSAG06_NODE_4359_length_4331_cov_7.796078_3_plen_181_part_00
MESGEPCCRCPAAGCRRRQQGAGGDGGSARSSGTAVHAIREPSEFSPPVDRNLRRSDDLEPSVALRHEHTSTSRRVLYSDAPPAVSELGNAKGSALDRLRGGAWAKFGFEEGERSSAGASGCETQTHISEYIHVHDLDHEVFACFAALGLLSALQLAEDRKVTKGAGWAMASKVSCTTPS